MKNNWIILILGLVLSGVSYGQNPAVNQTDEKGLKQGKWVKNYKSGFKRYEGTFQNDKPVGVFTYYYDDPKSPKQGEITYVLGNDTGSARFYHTNTRLMGEGKFLNQKREGVWWFYDNREVLSSRETFKAGQKHGLAKVYFLNGALASIVNYVEGKPEGPLKEYFEDGTVRIDATYKDGSFDGTYTSYYGNGKVLMTGEYVNKVKDGKWVYYQENGLIGIQEIWDNGYLEKRKVEEAVRKKAEQQQEERERAARERRP